LESTAKCRVTCVYDPNEIGKDEAWERITRDAYSDTKYARCSIHSVGSRGAHPVAKKPKIITYDGSIKEQAIDLSNPMFYQWESDRLRNARTGKDALEDELRRRIGEIVGREMEKEAKRI
jgi:hypothetical protein